MNLNRIVVSTAIGVLTIFSAYGQQLTRSPYSRYGIGEILSGSTSRNAAMGDIGVGSDNLFSINRINPASYADLVFTTMDISGFGQTSKFKTENSSEDQVTAGFQNIAFAFPSRKVSLAFGFAPYSVVGYEVGFAQDLIRGDTVTQAAISYTGDGGINQAFLGIAGKMLKNRLRLGANLAYSFGNTRYRTQTLSSATSLQYVRFSEEVYVGGFSGQVGMIWSDSIQSKKPLLFRLGTVADFNLNLDGTQEKLVQSVIGEQVVLTDTLTNRSGDISLPLKVGFGGSISRPGKWSVGMDFTVQNWENFTYFGEQRSLGTEWLLGMGGEFIPEFESYKFFKRMNYRLGSYYRKSYINYKAENVDDIGLTFGIGIPSAPMASDRFNPGRTTSLINISVSVGQRGVFAGDLPLKEQYIRLRLGFTLNDTWFIKRVVD